MSETTLVLLKPDCLTDHHAGDVIKGFEEADLEIVGCKMTFLPEQILAEHYAHVLDRPFYPELKAFMQSSSVIVLALTGPKPVSRVRDMIGPPDFRKAAKGTIPGDFGRDAMFNVVPAYDSPEKAALELELFFADTELYLPGAR